MEKMRTVTAGTLESSDVLVTLCAKDNGRQIDLESVAADQYREQILNVVCEVLDRNHLTDVYVKIIDKGALDFAIRARMETAVHKLMEGEF